MANRRLVGYQEEKRGTPASQLYDFFLDIERSSAGQPGLLVTCTRSYTVGEGTEREEERATPITVVVKDGVAVLAPVIAWLADEDLVEAVAKQAFEAHYGEDYGTWETQPDHVVRMFRIDARRVIEALVAVGQKRLA